MKKFNYGLTIAMIILAGLVFQGSIAFTDDTCVFMVTADDVEPNIVVLLDNGAEMQQAVWHTDYDDSADYTPDESNKVDVVPSGAGGNGFYNDAGLFSWSWRAGSCRFTSWNRSLSCGDEFSSAGLSSLIKAYAAAANSAGYQH